MSEDNKKFSLEDENINELQHGHEEEYYDDEDYSSEASYEHDKEKILDFLKYPKNKRYLAEYVKEDYKSREKEEIQRYIARKEYEHKSELEGSTPFHRPGHIGSLMYQYLNMVGVESAISSGLQHTKSSLTKTVQQKVDEINTLLRGVGGFNRQIKASFSRSAVLYLEQEDPRHSHRERVVFTVNIADFELRYPLDESAEEEIVEDGRTLRRLVWDESVNTIAEIISNTGLKPKYVKNDKNKCKLTMRQYLLGPSERMPDEYFEFNLGHVNQAKIDELDSEYHGKIAEFENQIKTTKAELAKRRLSKSKRAFFEQELHTLESDHEFYLATTPDPQEMDAGLIFSIYVNTMKDYTITKDKMQVIMTKFILALSEIATDKSMDQQVNTVYQQKQAKANNFQDLGQGRSKAKEERTVAKVSKKVG